VKSVLKETLITESASARQGRASDPLRSAWVGASAVLDVFIAEISLAAKQ
jgi:hypothetical protein